MKRFDFWCSLILVLWLASSGLGHAQTIESAGTLPPRGNGYETMALAYSPDGNVLAVADSEPKIVLWDCSAKKELVTLQKEEQVHELAFSPDGKTLISADWAKTLSVWDIAEKKSVAKLKGHQDEVLCVVSLPDGKSIVSGSRDKTIKRWDLATRTCLDTWTGHQGAVDHLAVSPDGKKLVSGSNDKILKVWDLATGKNVATFPGSEEIPVALAMSPKDNVVVSGEGFKGKSFGNSSIYLWDLETGKNTNTLLVDDFLSDLKFCPKSGWLVVITRNGRGNSLWDVSLGKKLSNSFGDGGDVLAIAPSGKQFAVGYGNGEGNGRVTLWNLSSKKP